MSRRYAISPLSALRSFKQHRLLIKQLVIRDIVGRYKGSLLGLLWSFLNPLLMLSLYSFVFTIVFKVRWGQETGAKGEFALILFAGLMLHNFLAECLMRAPHAISGNGNFVKKVIFPLEVLVPVMLGAAIFHLGVSILVLSVATLFIYHAVPWTILFFPLVVMPLVLATLGMMWLLASLGVYVRDITHMMGMLMTVLLFMSTILFPASSLPPAIQPFIYLNPLSFIADQMREIMLFGHPPYWAGLLCYSALSLFVCWLGYAWFQRTRKGFADVL